MFIERTEQIVLNTEEDKCLASATEILTSIRFELMDVTQLIDNQEFSDAINSLVTAAILLENKRIDSVFNVLEEKERREIIADVLRRERD